jgi:hypothetical protein
MIGIGPFWRVTFSVFSHCPLFGTLPYDNKHHNEYVDAANDGGDDDKQGHHDDEDEDYHADALPLLE